MSRVYHLKDYSPPTVAQVNFVAHLARGRNREVEELCDAVLASSGTECRRRLPCQNRNISALSSHPELEFEKKLEQPVAEWPLEEGYHRRLKATIEWQIQWFAQLYGVERLAMWTLTPPDGERDMAVFNKNFNRLNRRWLNEHFVTWVKVCERMVSGILHFHLLVVCPVDVQTGYNFQSGKRKRSACPWLREFWARTGGVPLDGEEEIRNELLRFGFGRSQLEPVRTTVKTISGYVSKYLGKHLHQRREADKGKRMVSFSRSDRSVGTRFQFNCLSAWAWRQQLGEFAAEKGCECYEDLTRKLGEGWCWKWRDHIFSKWERELKEHNTSPEPHWEGDDDDGDWVVDFNDIYKAVFLLRSYQVF